MFLFSGTPAKLQRLPFFIPLSYFFFLSVLTEHASVYSHISIQVISSIHAVDQDIRRGLMSKFKGKDTFTSIPRQVSFAILLALHLGSIQDPNCMRISFNSLQVCNLVLSVNLVCPPCMNLF